MKIFKIRCSAISKIMGRIGITDKQEQKLQELNNKQSLTIKQSELHLELLNKKLNPKLPATCISYLKEWYAHERYGDDFEFYSKQTDKGNLLEYDAINLVEEMEGESLLLKNEKNFENDYSTGTPDMLSGIGYDTKCSWNSKTFLDSVTETLDIVYEWQMRGYMWLTGLPKFKVCYCLLNTPSSLNYGKDVKYDDIPKEEKYKTFEVIRDVSKEEEIKERVELCRKWLEQYDAKINGLFAFNRLGEI